MRVISGFLKGKTISYIKNTTTRPLKDSVRENIFNILKHSKLINVNLEGGRVLDLYSGVGSFGIECISRGAKIVTFIEQNIETIKILKSNINQLSINNKTKLYNDNIKIILNDKFIEKYDIFFLDPPFLDKNFVQNLELIKNKKLFNKKHIVIIHRENKISDYLDNLLNIILIKKYGRSKILFGTFM